MRKFRLSLALWILLSFCGCWTLPASAQLSRLGEDVEYNVEVSGQVGSGDYTPFWQTANKYGLADTKNNSGYVRADIHRNAEADSLRFWRVGYGIDLASPFNYSGHFVLEQAFLDIQYKAIRLSLGQKERPSELKNQLLSSGGMTSGINSRPVPQVRIELPDFYSIKITKNWIAVKGHLAYGWHTDNRWQNDFASDAKQVYTQNSLYHSKAGFVRIGNLEKFPVTVTGGLEMVCQFGGTVWNRSIKNANGIVEPSYKLGSGIKQYLQAFIPSGSDITDGNNPNVMGNTVGSWNARLDYKGKTWGASFYAEHFFEDHGQMGLKFAWKDMLYGAEVNLPKNPFVSTLLYEHMRTTDQSGPVFKDKNTVGIGGNIGGDDDYYNHNIYGAYQHAGFVMGSPLILSPIYNTNSNIYCYDNRIMANHIGVCGQPCEDVSWRILYTHEKSWGTYKRPRPDPLKGQFWMVEATYKPHQLHGFGITASYGQNHGDLLGNSKGGMLTLSYSGWWNKIN